MFPTAPNVEGLPLWLQIFVSMAFIAVMGIAAVVGYRRNEARAEAKEPSGAAQTVIAAIQDTGATRHLADVSLALSGDIQSLEREIRDNTHWVRNKHEQDRELCARLRELREALDRQPR